MDGISKGSIWEGCFGDFPTLKRTIKTDVLVIGGGAAGLLTARLLTDSGVSCVVAEAGKICRGVTRFTTAKISAQHGLFCAKILKKYGEQKAKMYLEANLKAAEKFEELAGKINCRYEKRDSFVYSRNDRAALENELSALERIGFAASFFEEPPLPFTTVGAVVFKDQAQFSPLLFFSEISKGLEIYENTRIIDINEKTALSVEGRIIADKIVVATHFPFIDRRGLYFLKMYQSRSYVAALSGAPELSGIFVDENENGFSLRDCGDLLLISGGAHKTGTRTRFQKVFDFAEKHYPDSRIKNLWGAQDCMTADGIPYIGRYSKKTPELFVAAGFNKWGMTSAMAAAQILCDMILGKENDRAAVFSPSRSIFQKQVAKNALFAAKNFLTPTVPRCPHLGCALKYNSRERSWDCPCHGSRFTLDGKIIENPANSELE